MNLLCISELFLDEDSGDCLHETGIYETFTDNIKELFDSLRREYGKPTKMYVDDKDGNARQIGWCFTKKVSYEDCNEKYTRGVWVEVFDRMPETELLWEGNTHITRTTYFPHKF